MQLVSEIPLYYVALITALLSFWTMQEGLKSVSAF